MTLMTHPISHRGNRNKLEKFGYCDSHFREEEDPHARLPKPRPDSS